MDVDDESVDIDEPFECIPLEVEIIESSPKANLLPAKSQKIYEKAYHNFKQWCSNKQVKDISENIMLAYFAEEYKTKKSSSLWSTYSMLKSTMLIKENINIKSYSTLIAYLKRRSEGYRPKKSKVLTQEEVDNFIIQAPDDEYLFTKVALIIAVAGACRCDELLNLTVNDVRIYENNIFVTINQSKPKIQRIFPIINSNVSKLNYVEICSKYMALRPEHTSHDRFFVTYRKGKCSTQVVGKNKLGSVANTIAQFLKLPDTHLYTGHCFRRTSASLMADSGLTMSTVKRHVGWLSATVPEGCVENTMTDRIQIAQRLLCEGSKISSHNENHRLQPQQSSNPKSSNVTIESNSNCTFNIY